MNEPVPFIAVSFLHIDTLSRRDDWTRRLPDGLDADGVLAHFVRQVRHGGLLCTNITIDTHLRLRLRGGSDEGLAGGRAPALLVYRKQATLVVQGLEWVAPVEPQHHERAVSGGVYLDATGLYMERVDFDVLARLPRRRQDQRERLNRWRAYLAWRRKLVESDRAAAAYDAVAITPLGGAAKGETRTEVVTSPPSGDAEGETRTETENEAKTEAKTKKDKVDLEIVFRLIPGQHLPPVNSLVALPRSASADPTHWRPPVDRRRPRAQRLGDRIELGLDDDGATIVTVSRRMDHKEAGLLNFPAQGFLLADVGRELAQIARQEKTLDHLERDTGHHPALLDRLFGAGDWPASAPRPLADDEPAVARLTPDQRDAAARLAGEDRLVLVQGPPGTGKTTTIVAATRLVVQDGGRVLIASQSNLAVDNVLERLPRDPAIRPLRLAVDESKLEPSVEALVPKGVVGGHFLPTIAETIEARSQAAERTAQAHRARRQALELLGILAERHPHLQADLGDATADFERAFSMHSRATLAAQAAAAEVERLEGVAGAIHRIAQGEPGVAIPAPATALQALAPAAATFPTLAAVDAETLHARLDEAIGLCQSQGASASGRLAELFAERQRLVTAMDDDDLTRLAAVNREIKRLQGSAWAELTAWLRGVAPLADEAVAAVVDALQPGPTLMPAVDAAFAALRAQARAAATLAQARQVAAAADAAAVAHDLAAAREQLEGARDAQDDASLRAAEASVAAAEAALAELEARWAPLAAQVGLPASPTGVQVPAPDAADERLLTWQRLRAELLPRVRTAEAHASLQERYRRLVNVVGATCYVAAGLIDQGEESLCPFDLAIIDEVSKATAPELVGPALAARRLGLIGDPNQLQPLFRERAEGFREAIEAGLVAEEDFGRYHDLVTSGLFAELFEGAPEHARTRLTTQFRAHPDIMATFNHFYGGRLVAAPGTEDRSHGLTLPDRHGGDLLTPGQRVLWLASDEDGRGRPAHEEQRGSSKVNPLEARLIVETLSRLEAANLAAGFIGGDPLAWEARRAAPLDATLAEALPGVAPADRARLVEDGRVRVEGRVVRDLGHPVTAHAQLVIDRRRGVGVIALYGAQARLIQKSIKRKSLKSMDIRVETVDRFQGGEQPIVFVSLVRAPARGKVGDFARDFRRINVAFSRARDLLVIVGCQRALRDARVEIPGEAGPVLAYLRVMQHVTHLGGHREAARLVA